MLIISYTNFISMEYVISVLIYYELKATGLDLF